MQKAMQKIGRVFANVHNYLQILSMESRSFPKMYKMLYLTYKLRMIQRERIRIRKTDVMFPITLYKNLNIEYCKNYCISVPIFTGSGSTDPVLNKPDLDPGEPQRPGPTGSKSATLI